MDGSEAFVPIAKPVLGKAEMAAAARPISSGWVSQGPEVAAFEQEFAEYVDAEHACAVSNCTAALHLALLAVGVEPGAFARFFVSLCAGWWLQHGHCVLDLTLHIDDHGTVLPSEGHDRYLVLIKQRQLGPSI